MKRTDHRYSSSEFAFLRRAQYGRTQRTRQASAVHTAAGYCAQDAPVLRMQRAICRTARRSPVLEFANDDRER